MHPGVQLCGLSIPESQRRVCQTMNDCYMAQSPSIPEHLQLIRVDCRSEGSTGTSAALCIFSRCHECQKGLEFLPPLHIQAFEV